MRVHLLGVLLIVSCLAGCPQVADPLPPAPLTPDTASVPKPTSPIRFTDVAREAGLTEPHYNAADGRFRLVETMGSGVGMVDYDRDGRPDLLVLQGCDLPLDPDQKQHSARLYHNLGECRFEDVTAKAGIGFNGYGQGVAVGDYDNDGWEDVYISGFGRSALYRNNGDGTFREMTERAGVANAGWGTSCAFADLDGDGDLDLFVVHYLSDTVDDQGEPTQRCNATPGKLGYCPPHAHQPETDVLYRNNGDGTFTDVSQESGVASVAGNGLGLVIFDGDDDGKLDVFVANDQMPNFLYRNLGGLKFEEVARSWGLAYNEAGRTQAGMGVAAGDPDGDGRLDLLVTNFYEETNTLYRSLQPGVFTVATTQALLAAPSRGVLGFGTCFADFDLDGWQDLFVANGHINDVRPLGLPYRMPAQLFRNRGDGKFDDVSEGSGPYFQGKWLGRGAAVGDLDDDGDPDLVVTHLDDPPAVLRNDTSSDQRGHGLTLDLIDARGHRGPVGAVIEIETDRLNLTRHVVGGTSYLSASDPALQIGLGPSQTIQQLRVRWPSGRAEVWNDVSLDRRLRLEEGRSRSR